MNKLLIICGPTATGKTDLGILLAKKFGGEIISADSRQVYRGMDIGTGKDIPKNSELRTKNSELGIDNKNFTVGFREKDGVPIWLVDIVEPNYIFNVGEYVKLAQAVMDHLWSQKKLPIVVGGTGLYIKALIEPLSDVTIPPNPLLRKQLQEFTVWGLQAELQKVDVKKWEEMNGSDRKNPRRLVRMIEIGVWRKNQGRTTKEILNQASTELAECIQDDKLLIGLTAPKEELGRRIEVRVENRVKQGIVEEIFRLKKSGLGWKLPSMSGLGYKEWTPLFKMVNGQWSMVKEKRQQVEKDCIEKWTQHEEQYTKRQLTWFKKMENITWFDIMQENYQQQIIDQVKEWYNT